MDPKEIALMTTKNSYRKQPEEKCGVEGGLFVFFFKDGIYFSISLHQQE